VTWLAGCGTLRRAVPLLQSRTHRSAHTHTRLYLWISPRASPGRGRSAPEAKTPSVTPSPGAQGPARPGVRGQRDPPRAWAAGRRGAARGCLSCAVPPASSSDRRGCDVGDSRPGRDDSDLGRAHVAGDSPPSRPRRGDRPPPRILGFGPPPSQCRRLPAWASHGAAIYAHRQEGAQAGAGQGRPGWPGAQHSRALGHDEGCPVAQGLPWLGR
jgi:hypothetical protein